MVQYLLSFASWPDLFRPLVLSRAKALAAGGTSFRREPSTRCRASLQDVDGRVKPGHDDEGRHGRIRNIGDLTAISLALAVLTAAPAAAASLGPPPGATSCSGCHTAKPTPPDQPPSLNGRNAAEIVASVKAFRASERPATLMDRIAKGFSDEEIAAIAAWYQAQKE